MKTTTLADAPDCDSERVVAAPLLDGSVPLCIDDAMPDSWGRQVIQFRRGELTAKFGELTYLLESGSDRVGALDFQANSTTYVPRESTNPTLNDLYAASDAVNKGDDSVDRRLVDVLLNGTLMGGARPKAVLTVGGRPMIAKFSKSTDTFPWVQSEYVAMELARRAGVRVAPVEITAVGDRLALLVERFDSPTRSETSSSLPTSN